ncbi:MAG TPA: hypothetical protein VKQ06_06830, partial [Gammaproteobacteria bacterium]|nr:hypothetical protein [Gammaproteobacteria bacterium]
MRPVDSILAGAGRRIELNSLPLPDSRHLRAVELNHGPVPQHSVDRQQKALDPLLRRDGAFELLHRDH